MIKEINENTVDHLLQYMSQSEYKALVWSFIDDTQTLLKRISLEAFVIDHDAVIRHVHTIKGNASSLGFDGLSGLSSHMEAQLRKMTLNENSAIFTDYITETNRILTTITEYYTTNDNSGV